MVDICHHLVMWGDVDHSHARVVQGASLGTMGTFNFQLVHGPHQGGRAWWLHLFKLWVSHCNIGELHERINVCDTLLIIKLPTWKLVEPCPKTQEERKVRKTTLHWWHLHPHPLNPWICFPSYQPHITPSIPSSWHAKLSLESQRPTPPLPPPHITLA